jgi:hypothetical protein
MDQSDHTRPVYLQLLPLTSRASTRSFTVHIRVEKKLTRVTRDIGSQDGCKPAFDPRLGHLVPSDPA